MEDIKNIFCVGRNYDAHIKELHNRPSGEPVWFMKPSHSLVKLDNQSQLVLPSHLGELHYETELVIQMARDYVPDKPLHTLISKVALGLDLTLRELQSELKEQGLPWLRAKGFRQSALLTPSIPFSTLSDFEGTTFRLKMNDELVQVGKVAEMIFPLSELLHSCWEQFDLRAGDLIFTGTPAGVGAIQADSTLELFLNDGCLSKVAVTLQ